MNDRRVRSPRSDARRRAALLALGMAALAGCGKADAKAGGPRGPVAFPVMVEVAAARPIELAMRAVGTVEAFETVTVVSRVAGVVEEVRFQEGDRVEAGQVLAAIELQRFRIAAESARATLAQAEANRVEAVTGLERRETLEKQSPGLVKGEELQQWKARADAAAAQVAAAKAASDLALLNLRDAEIRSPIAGVIQTRAVATGRYVQAGDAVATLVRAEPLLLRFAVPGRDAALLQVGMKVGFTVRGELTPREAAITLVAAAADPRSRLVPVSARIDAPPTGALRPGAFAEVAVMLTTNQAVTVPATTIRPSERGNLAYVVVDGQAKERTVETGLRSADGRVEVRRGIAVGEQVVVRGAEALSDGAKVVISADGGPAAAPGGPGGGRPGGAKPGGKPDAGARPSSAGAPERGAGAPPAQPPQTAPRTP